MPMILTATASQGLTKSPTAARVSFHLRGPEYRRPPRHCGRLHCCTSAIPGWLVYCCNLFAADGSVVISSRCSTMWICRLIQNRDPFSQSVAGRPKAWRVELLCATAQVRNPGCRYLGTRNNNQLSQMDPRDVVTRASYTHRWTLGTINWSRSSVERRPLQVLPNNAATPLLRFVVQ